VQAALDQSFKGRIVVLGDCREPPVQYSYIVLCVDEYCGSLLRHGAEPVPTKHMGGRQMQL
jgi:hypothetical protein